MRMGINAANSWFRRVAAERRAQVRVRPSEENHPDEADRLAVRAALRELPQRQRTALILRFYVDLSVEDTAGVMRCSPGTVKAHTAKGVAALRRQGLTDA